MAQSERALVHPLEIVDRQECRLERPGSPMSGLEDPHRLERRGPRRRIEEDCLQPFAVARALREPSEESRRRRERDLAFGSVADDAEPIRNVDTPRGLREEPALADTGIPDDERRHRPADRGARDGLDKRLELGGPAHERPGHGSSVDRSEPPLRARATARSGRRTVSTSTPGCFTTAGYHGATRRVSRSAPERIRTSDLRFRRPTLYPAELRALAATG